MPQGLIGFLTRIVVQEPSLGCTAIVTQALEAVSESEATPVILDIDVFKEEEFDPNGESPWAYLQKLRGFKNRIFFESITPELLELYK